MITILENIINSLESIKSNKLRSSLSMLGIIIGVCSVIILTAIGNGSQQSIVSKIEEMGTNVLTISTGGNGRIGGKSTSQSILTDKVVATIKKVNGIKNVLPIISSNGQLVYGSNNMSASVMGITTDYLSAKNVDIELGNNISEENSNNLEKVVVLGKDVKTELFGEDNPIGKNVKMGKDVFRVIGVIEENSTLGSNVFIPISTASIRITGQKYYSQIIVMVENSENITQNQEDVNNALIKLLKVTDTDNLPYRIRNNSEMLQNMSSITGTLTMLLSGIAGISLLVGGIGVMNIMLVSVTERTKEIGIRKAIGADKSDILLQFLTESGSISVLGGLIGIAISYAIVFLLTQFSISAIISTQSIVTSFCFSLGIGIIFGLLPAYKAAKLRPIEALRFE